jgi:GlpG protein
MRQIGTIPDERTAARFADYLLTLGITTRVDAASDGQEIWIIEEDHVEKGREELRRFLADPENSRYVQAGRHADSLRKATAEEERRRRKNFVDVGDRWRRGGAGRRPLTLALIAACVLVAILSANRSERRGGTSPVVRHLIIGNYQVEGPDLSLVGLREIREGQVWRLVTPIFLHFGILHLGFNMLWLLVLGSQIESRRGTLRFGTLVLLTAIASNLGQYAMTGWPMFGGMSGVVYGLFGYVWMKSRFDPGSGLYIHGQTVMFMLVWFVLCFTGFVGPIANWAHGVGLAIGVLVGYAPVLRRRIGG